MNGLKLLYENVPINLNVRRMFLYGMACKYIKTCGSFNENKIIFSVELLPVVTGRVAHSFAVRIYKLVSIYKHRAFEYSIEESPWAQYHNKMNGDNSTPCQLSN